MACCGRACQANFNNTTITEAYIGELTVDGEAVDVTHFGDLAAGSTIVCKETAQFVINSYEDPGVSVAETVDVDITVCTNVYSCATCEVVSKNCKFEASGVPYWVTTLRAEGTVTGF